MARKTDFTTEEWIILRAALDATLYDTAEVDEKIYDTEAKTARRLEHYTLPLVQELLDRGSFPEEDDLVTTKASTTPLDSLYAEALDILKHKATHEEIHALSWTIHALALAVAEADDNVDIREKTFIQYLENLLQTWDEA